MHVLGAKNVVVVDDTVPILCRHCCPLPSPFLLTLRPLSALDALWTLRLQPSHDVDSIRCSGCLDPLNRRGQGSFNMCWLL